MKSLFVILPNFTPRNSNLCLPSSASFKEEASLYPAFFANAFACFKYSGSPVASSTSNLSSACFTSASASSFEPWSIASSSSTPPYKTVQSESSNPPINPRPCPVNIFLPKTVSYIADAVGNSTLASKVEPPFFASSAGSAFAYNALSCSFALAKGKGSLLCERSVPFVNTFHPL